MLNSLSDEATPMALITGHRISLFYLVSMQSGSMLRTYASVFCLLTPGLAQIFPRVPYKKLEYKKIETKSDRQKRKTKMRSVKGK